MSLERKWSATAASSKGIDGNPRRGKLFIQNFDSENFVNLGISKAAKVDEGVRIYPGDTVTLTGWEAKQDIYFICDTAKTASGGWE